MFLIIGLGNPGPEYQNTPHNLGFLAVDKFQQNNNLPDFKLNKKSQALICQGILGWQQVTLAKPQTFMNNSGLAVKKLSKKEVHLIVIHDDLAFPLGQIKISQAKSANSHKGVESIIKELGHKNFTRIRLGTKPSTITLPTNLAQFVLKSFKPENQALLNQALQLTSQALKTIIDQGPEKAMTRFNHQAKQKAA